MKTRVIVLCGFFLLSWGFLNRQAGIAYEEVIVSKSGAIRGAVTYEGSPVLVQPIEISKDQDVCGKTEKVEESVVVGKDRGLANVVVFLSNIERGKGFSTANVELDQRACRYNPHIVLVPAGKPVTIRNPDGILHSVHTHSVLNPSVNRTQSKFKTELAETFVQPETIQVTCDVHSWMRGWIVVQPHPYFTVTNGEGGFLLTEVPVGEYLLKFWHETLGEKEVTIFVDEEKEIQVSVQFP